MPTDTSDQQITMPVDADSADNPVAFVNSVADIETRLVRRYTSEADRTARMLSLSENDISTLATEDRAEIYNGSAHVSLYRRSLFALARKTANLTLTQNSTALQNVTELLAAVPTAGTFGFRAVIYYSSATVADIKFAFLLPAGGTVLWGGIGVVTGGGASGDANFATAAASDATVPYGGNAVGVVLNLQIEGEYTAGGTAGNLQLRAAQNTADLSNTVIHAGSRLEVWRHS
jgi:hypothetical protein